LLTAPPPATVPPAPREATIQEAKQLAWLNNWAAAARVLERIEPHGLEPANQAIALFARAAHIRGNVEGMSLPEAAAWLTSASDVARGAGLDRIEATASSALASMLRDTGEIETAKSSAKRSVAAAQRAGDLYHLPQMMAALAEIEAASGNFIRAEAAYARATDLVDALLRGFPHPRHKNTLIATMSRVFDGHLALALDRLHDVGKSFQILESARARGLIDLLQGTDVGPMAYPRMTRDIAALNRDLASEEDPGRRGLLLERLWELEVRSIRPRTPSAEWRDLHAARPVSLQRLQESLADDELVIEYVLAHPRSFALAISHEQVTSYHLKGRSELESAAESHLAAIRDRRTARAEAKALYELLLQPVALLGQRQRLVIVPDGKLHLVAFDALVDPEDRYVAETHVISYAPSATAYYLLSSPPPNETAQVALLGVVARVIHRPKLRSANFTCAAVDSSPRWALPTGPLFRNLSPK
jgi:hypothetical protein